MVTCRETVGDTGRSLSQTSYFSDDRRCSCLHTISRLSLHWDKMSALSEASVAG
jgi:hypothetical protein